MYTRKNLCFPTFHSTSTTSSPSDRATRSAAARIFSKFTRRLLRQGRYQVHSNRQQQKSGLAPTHPCDPLQSEFRVYSATTAKASYPRAKAYEPELVRRRHHRTGISPEPSAFHS